MRNCIYKFPILTEKSGQVQEVGKKNSFEKLIPVNNNLFFKHCFAAYTGKKTKIMDRVRKKL